MEHGKTESGGDTLHPGSRVEHKLEAGEPGTVECINWLAWPEPQARVAWDHGATTWCAVAELEQLPEADLLWLCSTPTCGIYQPATNATLPTGWQRQGRHVVCDLCARPSLRDSLRGGVAWDVRRSEVAP